MTGIRDRIIEFRRVPAHELTPNPRNWRKHPEKQRAALRGMLEEVGFAGAELCRVLEDGSLMLIDGHLRQDVMGEQEIPCLITDLDEAEADKLLATYDPLSAMAEADTGKLDELLREVETGSEAVAEMLAKLAEESGVIPGNDNKTELKQINTMPPPKMTWVLIGIPTVRFGEINEAVESLSQIGDIILETSSNDG